MTSRLNKRMAQLGLCSRREADDWIEQGWVRVNGQLAVMGLQVADSARIDIDPAARGQQLQRVTILLHKPIGYVSAQAEDGHEPAVKLVNARSHWTGDGSKLRFVSANLRGLAPAGRLDIDSVGLLVLTQDGRVARHLIGEDSVVEKEYLVRVTDADKDSEPQPNVMARFPQEQLARLRHGLQLDNQALKPAKVSWQNEDQLRMVLREGKKRQIRRMCEQVGLRVLGLKRIRIGSVLLGQLPLGQWRYLGPFERF
jgi:23S rRNA pseudouridine2604 synthase